MTSVRETVNGELKLKFITSEHKLNNILGFSSRRSDDAQVFYIQLVFVKIKIENCPGFVHRVTDLAPVLFLCT